MPRIDEDTRIARRGKGWVLQAGFLIDYIKKYYTKDSAIVDLGSGAGHWLLQLKENGYTNVYGVDLDNFIVFPEIRELNRFKAADLNKDRLPFEDASTDLIICTQVFEHLENPFHFERECARILKPGGLLVLSYPYGWSIQSRLKFLLRKEIIGWRAENSHITFMTPSTFAKCFLKDFHIIRTEYGKGRTGIWGFEFDVPANKHFSDSVCYFLEKRYNADYYRKQG